MTIIANLFVCALLLMSVAALWTLAHVWMERDKLGSSKLVRGDDPCADKTVDPVVKHRDYELYPTKCTNCQGDPDGCMNCRD